MIIHDLDITTATRVRPETGSFPVSSFHTPSSSLGNREIRPAPNYSRLKSSLHSRTNYESDHYRISSPIRRVENYSTTPRWPLLWFCHLRIRSWPLEEVRGAYASSRIINLTKKKARTGAQTDHLATVHRAVHYSGPARKSLDLAKEGSTTISAIIRASTSH